MYEGKIITEQFVSPNRAAKMVPLLNGRACVVWESVLTTQIQNCAPFGA